MMPKSSSLVTAFGFRSDTKGFILMFWYVLKSVFHTMDLPVPAKPMMKTECRTSSSSTSCTTWGRETKRRS